MTYATPKMNSQGQFSGDLTPLGVTMDASGGWWDAGDYLKFVETTSYAVALMEVGARSFPASMGTGSAHADFVAEAMFGIQWLEKMWNDSTKTLYYQVGIGEGNATTVGDHDIWRLPQADDTYGGTNPADRYIRNRPVFEAGPPGSPVSPNLAGRLAADFGLCAQLFASSDPTFASTCLRDGEDVYALADTHPTGNLLTTAPYDFYPETQWRDDMELGATELAAAVGPGSQQQTYLAQAADWAAAYIASPDQDTLNLYDVGGLAHYELARLITQTGATGLAVTTADPREPVEDPVGASHEGGEEVPVRLRLPVELVRHGLPRVRSVGHGQRVRRAHRDDHLRRPGPGLGRQRAGRQSVGGFLRGRRRHHLPRLHATPGGQPDGFDQRNGAHPGRGGGGGADRSRHQGSGVRHGHLPSGGREPVRRLQRSRRGVQGQRPVLFDRRAGHRPDGGLAPGLRLVGQLGSLSGHRPSGRGYEIGHHPGQLGTLVLLQEVAATGDGHVWLALRSGDALLEDAVRSGGDGVSVAEGGQERLGELRKDLPCGAVGRARPDRPVRWAPGWETGGPPR